MFNFFVCPLFKFRLRTFGSYGNVITARAGRVLYRATSATTRIRLCGLFRKTTARALRNLWHGFHQSEGTDLEQLINNIISINRWTVIVLSIYLSFMYSCFRNDIKWQRALAGLLSFVLKYEMLFNITTGVDINQHKRGTFQAKVHSTARKRARGLFTLAIGPIY